MNLFQRIGIRLRSLFRYGQRGAELDEEIQTHLELRVEELMAQGATDADARRQARREFGHVDSTKEVTRDTWGVGGITNFFRDLRFSARSLRKSPGFSLTVIATLALCIGANTTVFALLHELVFKPLPFPNADRIVQVLNIDERSADNSHSSWNQYRDFEEHADLFEGFALGHSESKILHGAPFGVMRVTADFFDLMDVSPVRGRFFTPEEVDPGPGRVAVLTHTTWENDYAADPNIVGSELRLLNDSPVTIVGIAPQSMEVFDRSIRCFMPFNVPEVLRDPRNRSIVGFDLWARLKPDVDRTPALEQLISIEREWFEEFPGESPETGTPRILKFGRAYQLQNRLMLLQSGALLVLLVGCFNAVNLLLIRASRKRHELSVRHSFGAGKLALVRLMLCESLQLGAAGALVGCALSWVGLQVINHYLAVLIPKAASTTLGSTVFVSTLAITGVVALVMGLLPVTLLWKSGRIQKMDGGVRGSTAGLATRTLTSGLIVAQVAITFALLSGAGLLFRSLNNVLAVDPGFDASRVVEGSIWLPPRLYQNADRIGARQRVMAAMKEIPGVENVSFSANRRMVGELLPIESVFIRGGPFAADGSAPRALVKHVSNEFFATMGIPILEGRSFAPDDDQTSFVVDDAFARRYLQGQPQLGAEVRWGSPTGPWKRVVGIAGRAIYKGLEDRDGLPVLYVCSNQYQTSTFSLLLRTTRPAEIVIREARTKLQEIDPELYLVNPTSLEVPLGNLHLERQGTTLLTGVFAALALFVSAIGIYGILAYDVQQRRREFGIRAAIGANRLQVLTMVLQQGLWKTGLGLVLGLIGAFAVSQYLSSLLFDVSALDPVTYLAVVVGLSLVALTASLIPARRATKVDPAITLRAE